MGESTKKIETAAPADAGDAGRAVALAQARAAGTSDDSSGDRVWIPLAGPGITAAGASRKIREIFLDIKIMNAQRRGDHTSVAALKLYKKIRAANYEMGGGRFDRQIAEKFADRGIAAAVGQHALQRKNDVRKSRADAETERLRACDARLKQELGEKYASRPRTQRAPIVIKRLKEAGFPTELKLDVVRKRLLKKSG